MEKVVIRHTAENVLDSGTTTQSVRDIEIRVKDTTSPYVENIDKPWGSNFLEVGSLEFDPSDSDKKLSDIINNHW